MLRFDLVSSSGDGRTVALSRVPPPVVTDAAMLSVFSSSMEARIFSYCVVVAAASASITMVLLVDVADRTPKWTSKFSMKEAGAPAMCLPGVPAVVGEKLVLPCLQGSVTARLGDLALL